MGCTVQASNDKDNDKCIVELVDWWMAKETEVLQEKTAPLPL